MALSMKDSVVHWRKKLEREQNEETILGVIHKLAKVPISAELLEQTHIGKTIRLLSKREDIVGGKALSLLKRWRDVFTKIQEAKFKSEKPTTNKKDSSKESSIKHNRKHESSHKKKISHSKHKQKSESSVSHNLPHYSKPSLNGDCLSISKESSPSLYAYEKQKCETKYMDYDPHTDINEGYNPECPELYPGSKSHKIKISESLTDTYKPSSVKHKSSSGEKVAETKDKHKKLKIEKCTGTESSSLREAKQSTEKNEKCSVHKDKSKDSKSRSSTNYSNETIDKIKPVTDSSKHKLLSESKKSKSKDSSEKKKLSSSVSKGKIKINCSEEFTSSEVRFEDCLGFNDIVTVKKRKTVKSQSSNKSSPSKSSSISKKPVSGSHKTTPTSSFIKEVRASSKSLKEEKLHLKVPKPVTKLEVDIVSTLPQTMPTYRPLPQPRILEASPSKKKVLSNEEAIKFTSSRREKTAVYSGRKSHYTQVPSLFEISTQKLIENIDAIEYMGNVPYYLIKAVLVRANPTQLENIENFNPHLLEDTHELWEIHCKKDYKLLKPQENETWRDLHLRASEEREHRLRAITANISASMSKSNPVRQVKLAYVDSVVKPPRDVARRQAKHGTGLPVAHPVKAGPPSKATPRPIAPVINVTVSAAASTPAAIYKTKPKVAPLMAKTLKSMKMCFRR